MAQQVILFKAIYHTSGEHSLVLPEGVSKDDIDFYSIKYGEGVVVLKNGTELPMLTHTSPEDNDFKRPDEQFTYEGIVREGLDPETYGYETGFELDI